MLKVNNITVKFGGLTAVKDMSMVVEEGKIHSLIGPNGAGKTTLFNVITRIINPNTGTIHFKESLINKLNTNHIIFKGISRTFQNLQLFSYMTVYENIYSGYVHKYRKGMFSVFAQMHKKFDDEAREKVLEISELLNIKNRLSSFPSSLSYGILKRVEIARALISNPSMLLLDEPAAGLNTEETAELDEILTKINKSGVTILLVEHDMNLVMKISDRITVMNFGEKLAEGTPKEVANNPKVISVYLGDSDDSKN